MRVFLSYRRDDTAGRAGRIADVFTARYGARNVFQDIDTASPGLDFAERVDDGDRRQRRDARRHRPRVVEAALEPTVAVASIDPTTSCGAR